MKKVLVYGDSNTWGWDPRGMFGKAYDLCFVDHLNQRMPNYLFFKDGENGRLVRDADYENDLRNIDLFMVMLGSNDLLHYYEVGDIVKNLNAFLENKDKSKIVILCPPILHIITFNQVSICLNEAYKKMGYKWIDCNPCDMAYDGVHLSEKGHYEFASKIMEYLKSGFA